MASFEPADERHLEILMSLKAEFHAFFNESYDAARARKALQGLLADSSHGRAWLIQADDRQVGYVVLCFGYSLEYGGRDAFIDELFIQSAYRQQGLGKETLKFVENCARQFEVNALHLEVDKTNLPAQMLYQKFGFADNNRYLMTKWLE